MKEESQNLKELRFLQTECMKALAEANRQCKIAAELAMRIDEMGRKG